MYFYTNLALTYFPLVIISSKLLLKKMPDPLFYIFYFIVKIKITIKN